MSRLNVMLLVLVVVSGLYLVQISYDARRLFAALDRAQTRERELATEFERLELSRRTAATAVRVERVAQDRLGMRAATPAVTEYLSGVGSPAAANGGAP